MVSGAIECTRVLMNRICVNIEAKGEVASDFRNSEKFEAARLDEEQLASADKRLILDINEVIKAKHAILTET